jgi:aminotransferase
MIGKKHQTRYNIRIKKEKGEKKMEHLLNQGVKKIQISGIRRISEEIKKYPDVLSLTIGEPDFKSPEIVKLSGKKAIDDNFTFYAPNAGILELRQAAGEFVKRKYNLSYNPENEVIVTNGSTESIFIALKTLLTTEDEVLIPTPTYPGYEPVVEMCGAKLIPIDVSETKFKLTKEQLEKHITEKTKVLILPYPSNPTGAILTENEVKELIEVLKDKEIFIISDELYSELVFEETHYSIAKDKEMREKTIVINGLSKSHAMTGWRLGFTFAPKYITAEMLKVHQYVNTSVNTMAQKAGVDALLFGDEAVEQMKKEYQKRRDFLHQNLSRMGFDVLLPEGTFYMFPNISRFSNDSHDFSMKLLEQARVGVLPSSVFTYGGNQHLRISYASSMEKLEEFINRVEKYLS